MDLNEAIEFGRRALACESWVWLPGMLAISTQWKRGKSARLFSVQNGEPYGAEPNETEYCWGWEGADGYVYRYHYVDKGLRDGLSKPAGFVPDFRDPVTFAAVSDLVRRRKDVAALIDDLETSDRLVLVAKALELAPPFPAPP